MQQDLVFQSRLEDNGKISTDLLKYKDHTLVLWLSSWISDAKDMGSKFQTNTSGKTFMTTHTHT